jgi:hypothetical protein
MAKVQRLMRIPRLSTLACGTARREGGKLMSGQHGGATPARTPRVSALHAPPTQRRLLASAPVSARSICSRSLIPIQDVPCLWPAPIGWSRGPLRAYRQRVGVKTLYTFPAPSNTEAPPRRSAPRSRASAPRCGPRTGDRQDPLRPVAEGLGVSIVPERLGSPSFPSHVRSAESDQRQPSGSNS